VRSSSLLQKPRQLGDVHRNQPRLITRQPRAKPEVGNVRFVPKAAVSRRGKNPLFDASLLDHLVGAHE
jgi:hypothetical protein